MTSIARMIALARSRDVANGAKPVARQLAEMTFLWLRNGNGPAFYQMAGFWRQGTPVRSMLAHLSSREYNAEVDRLNPQPYHKISQHKVAEKAMLTLFGIPTARFLAMLDADRGSDASGAPLRTPADLERAAEAWPARVCFKRVEGSGGSSFVGVVIDRGGGAVGFRDMRGGEPMCAETLWGRLHTPGEKSAHIVEAYLDQHPWYAALHPSSLNSFRIWVARSPEGARTVLAYLRMGRSGSLVDNRLFGGIVAGVDLATGRLNAGADGGATALRFPRHPDTGTPLEGEIAPGFADACRLAERAMLVFPHLNFAGADISMTPDGPTVIELNLLPSREGAVFTDTPSSVVRTLRRY